MTCMGALLVTISLIPALRILQPKIMLGRRHNGLIGSKLTPRLCPGQGCCALLSLGTEGFGPGYAK
jgi:hypothetical protein